MRKVEREKRKENSFEADFLGKVRMNDFFYKKLEAYKLAKEFTIYVYSLLKAYPIYEQYAICDQLRRAAVSVPSNIAEGMGRMSVKERLHFLEISYASIMEVLCQLDISLSLGYINEAQLSEAESLATTLTKVMSGLRKSLENKNKANQEGLE